MKQYILILSFLMAPSLCFTQEILPCVEESFDTEKEMREIGVGKGETVYDATYSAVLNALQQLKSRLEESDPNTDFDYSITKTVSEQGEQLEIETPLGQPNIVCNEIQQLVEGGFVVYLALSMDMHTWKTNKQ